MITKVVLLFSLQSYVWTVNGGLNLVSRLPLSGPLQQACTNSLACPETNRCCRSSKGTLIDTDNGGFWNKIRDTPGTCSSKKSGLGAPCNNICGCIQGYVCYRPLTGMCCPPKRCWTKEAVRKEEARWKNCSFPKCRLPM